MRFDTMQEVRLPLNSASILASTLRESGVDASCISEALGHLGASCQRTGNGMVRAIDEWQFQRNFAQLAPGGPSAWLRTGRKYRLMDNGTVGMTLFSAPTLHDVTNKASELCDLIYSAARIEQIHDNGRLTGIAFDLKGIPAGMQEFSLYHVVGGSLTALNDLWLGRFPVARIDIEFGRPADAEFEAEFDFPISFSAHRSAIYWDPDLSRRPLFYGNQRLFELYAHECDGLIQSASQSNSFLRSAATAIRSVGEGHPSLIEVAERLGMSERTFQRRLGGYGLTFRHLSDLVRSEMARELLASRDCSIEEVAARIGYADASSFSQAFLRWTGGRPGRYR